MSGYDFLKDLIVLEVSQLGPDGLGMQLADMGATVVKVETPDGGDPVRYSGFTAVGEPDGFSYMHMRWNRGKRSLSLDMKTDKGREIFRALAAKADVVIEGMRAGVLERLGLGYEALKAINPRLVFCTINGMGATGPYAPMASHGPSFDAYGGLGQIDKRKDISNFGGEQPTSIGMHAVGIVAAVGVLSAVIKAQRTGEGAALEVAAADCAALWLPDAIDPVLNPDQTFERPGFADSQKRMLRWPRMDNYRTADGKAIYFMGLTEKYWQSFARLVDRPDLATIYADAPSEEDADRIVHGELTAIFLTRSQADWIAALRTVDIPVMPVNSFKDVVADPHFVARNNVYAVTHPKAGKMTLVSTPIKTSQPFRADLAPLLGEHSEALLQDLLGLDGEAVAALRTDGVVG
ncbi:CaiB/BaiF CoA-transferase family protein [Sphingobium sp. EM0848]|uniref:CaiB/BaiF CoA transferase family protein n=1 Tax=Sphingobium sp. EM0848 TaxID=2743473 RepID=UPI00159C71BA|nr:CaiB/BaiF CoA-transferase family protein [Sphingobium sp. EM0848]